MNRLLILALGALAVAGCDGPPCLSKNQPAVVEQVGTVAIRDGADFGHVDPDNKSVKLRLADNSKRVCVVPLFVAQQLKPGDVVRGPISGDNDWRYL